jgi:hypothetical protein
MRMSRIWFQDLMILLPKSSVLLCVSCGQKDSIQRLIIKKLQWEVSVA